MAKSRNAIANGHGNKHRIIPVDPRLVACLEHIERAIAATPHNPPMKAKDGKAMGDIRALKGRKSA